MLNSLVSKFSRPSKETVEKIVNSNKLTLLQQIQKSNLPPQGKIIAATVLKQLNEDQVTTLIRDFYLMLNKRDEIQETIRTKFPSVNTEA